MQLTQMNIQSYKQLVSMKNKECLYLQQFHKLQKFLVPSSWFCAFIQMQIISKSTDSPMENLLSPSVTFWSLFTSYPACGYYSNEAFPQKNKSRLIMSSDIIEEYFNVQRIGLSCIVYTPPAITDKRVCWSPRMLSLSCTKRGCQSHYCGLHCQHLLCELLSLATIILPQKNMLDKKEIIFLLGDRDINLKEKKGVLFYQLLQKKG